MGNLVLFTSHKVYCAKANNKYNEDSVKEMSRRLAIEVMGHIHSKASHLLRPNRPGRLSFIGHSAGGLVIRKVLEESALKPVLSKLYLYISLATPHLGTLYSDSKIVSTGMWALAQWKKSPTLREIMLEDGLTNSYQNSLLYQLSSNGVLLHFQYVVLVSSPADQYVPAYSARIQHCPQSKAGPAILEMASNLLAQVEHRRLFRITIDNNVGTELLNVDNIIGRTAHICYLENPTVTLQLVYTLYSFFDMN